MTGSAIDPVAFARLAEITGDDPAFLSELVDTYLEDGAIQVEALRTAAASGDVAALVRPAHTLKSSSASIGAMTLAEDCRSLEADARADLVTDAAARADTIAAGFDAVRTALRGDQPG